MRRFAKIFENLSCFAGVSEVQAEQESAGEILSAVEGSAVLDRSVWCALRKNLNRSSIQGVHADVTGVVSLRSPNASARTQHNTCLRSRAIAVQSAMETIPR